MSRNIRRVRGRKGIFNVYSENGSIAMLMKSWFNWLRISPISCVSSFRSTLNSVLPAISKVSSIISRSNETGFPSRAACSQRLNRRSAAAVIVLANDRICWR